MAFDVFLKVDGVDGESADAKHKGTIDVLSFGFGVVQSAPAGGGRAGAGKASFQDLHVVFRTEKASPRLFVGCAAGEHFKNAVLTARRAGKGQVEFLKLTLSDVVVTSYRAAGAAAEDGPHDEVTLGYAKIEIEYRPVTAKGAPGSPVKGGWDLKANKKL